VTTSPSRAFSRSFRCRSSRVATRVWCAAGVAQRPLTHDDYDQWKSVRATTLSDDGAWVAYQIEPQWGDGELVVQQTTGDAVYRTARGAGARFTSDGRYCVFTVVPSKVEERHKKVVELAQKKGAPSRASRGGAGAPGVGAGAAPAAGAGPAGPGEGDEAAARERGELAILDLRSGRTEKLGKVKGFALAEAMPWLVYHRDPTTDGDAARGDANEGATEPAAGKGNEPAAGAAPEPAAGAERPRRGRRGGARDGDADPAARKRVDGSPLVVRDLASGQERSIDDVVGYTLLPKATWLCYHTSSKSPKPGKHYGLFATRLDGSAEQTLVDGFADFSGFAADRQGRALAFLCTLDDFAADKPRKDLWLWRGAGPAQRIVQPGTPGMPPGFVVADGTSFARDGRALLLSLQADEPELPAMLAEDKVVLDVWHWNDGVLQTAQQKRLRAPQRRAVWHLDEARLCLLDREPGENIRWLTPDGARALASDSEPYDKLTSWDARYEDVWLVNTVDGSRTKVLEKLRGAAGSSPNGRYLVWFAPDQHWWSLDVATQQKRDLTGSLAVAFHRDDDDRPEPDAAWGIAGWTTGDAAVLLYDEFDVWQVTPATGAAVCVTDGFGRQSHERLRVQRLPRDDDDDDGTLAGTLVLTAQNVDTMAESIVTDEIGAVQRPRRLLQLDEHFGDLRRAKSAPRWVFTRSTFAQCPDLWTCDQSFAAPRRLSDCNPQQQEFRWGSARLVRWTNADGVPLKGVLVVPDGFDPKQKYPMLVYFYERMSQGLHNYVAPAPGTSPNASYYVSNGYLWFMPDVVYTTGYPGESCVKCVVSGVQSLVAQGFVDEHAIGAAGHSWGGYQTAFLVTRTNLFTAVESGAPVSDMMSAYGGIRYESGVSRQFQYERTQSRIGGTPWEYPMRYWENSPIWFADKVHTPVLILANDKDGAVPWTQGIEYYTALRRLGREAYLFDYVGEGHGLRQRQNMKDWTRRMSEYFAHHLCHAPMPKWMQDGVPFRDRDREKVPFTPSVAEVRAAAAAAAASAAKGEGQPAGTAVPAAGSTSVTGDASPVPAVEKAGEKGSGAPAATEPAPAGAPAPAAPPPKPKKKPGALRIV
jgi:dipeptidyl aminopeptidase/acylaminoacyl peptidase